MRTHWRLTAAILAAAAVLFAVLLYNASPWLQHALDFSGEIRAGGLTPPPPQTLALIISGLGLMVTSLGTIFTVVFGLRHERREVAESRLRIQELEIELTRVVAVHDATERRS